MASDLTTTRHPVVTAIIWMSGALISFSVMAIAARELSAELSTFQILAFRSMIGLLIVSALLSRSGWQQLKTDHLGLHAMRNAVHFTGQFCWFYAIAFIPLAAVFAMEFTVPIWTALFAAILLGERITLPRVLAILIGLSGVLVMLRPGLAMIHPAALVALASAVAYGMTHTLTKKLSGRDTALTLLFYMMLMQLPLGLIPSLFSWTTPSQALWPWLVIVGITGLTAHYCIVRAMAVADATIVVPMDFMRLPLIALVGFLLYGERLDIFLLLGAVLIIAGNLVNVFSEKRRSRS